MSLLLIGKVRLRLRRIVGRFSKGVLMVEGSLVGGMSRDGSFASDR